MLTKIGPMQNPEEAVSKKNRVVQILPPIEAAGEHRDNPLLTEVSDL